MQIRNCLCDANIVLYQDMIMRQRQMINKQCVTQNRKGQVSILVVKSHMPSCPKRFRCFCFTYINFSDVAGVLFIIWEPPRKSTACKVSACYGFILSAKIYKGCRYCKHKGQTRKTQWSQRAPNSLNSIGLDCFVSTLTPGIEVIHIFG